MHALFNHSPYRISAGCSLLFKRCVVLTLRRLISTWRRGDACSAILAKPLADFVTVLCLGQCKSRHLKVCIILKMTCYFQTNWMSYILNWDVRCLCWQWGRFYVLLFWASSSCLPLHWRTSLSTFDVDRSRHSPTKIVPWLQSMISFILWKSMHQRSRFLFLWIKR